MQDNIFIKKIHRKSKIEFLKQFFMNKAIYLKGTDRNRKLHQ